MNINDYVRQAHQSFREKPFNNVDSLVLCQIFYAKLETVLDGEGLNKLSSGYAVKDFNKAEYYDEMFNDHISDPQNYDFMREVVASKRYRDLKVKNVVAEQSDEYAKQFAAACFEIDENTDYVCFRGTDGSMSGWKEDFEMSFRREVPSQKAAVEYINRLYGPLSKGRKKSIYIGGHSKGGNLAVYGGVMCNQKIHDRIKRIYSHDGPGFRDEVSAKIVEITERDHLNIVRHIPQGSIVGRLLEHGGDFTVVKSTALGIMQHAAYSWEIEGDDFVKMSSVSRGSELTDRALSNWLIEATDEQREEITGLIFDTLHENGIDSVRDLKSINSAKFMAIMKSLESIPEEKKETAEKLLRMLLLSAIKEAIPLPDANNLMNKLSEIKLSDIKLGEKTHVPDIL